MTTQILFNELVVGDMRSDRLTTVPVTIAEARVVFDWYHKRVNDEALYFMLEGHPILTVDEDCQFGRVHFKGHATQCIEVRFADGSGYRIYVPSEVRS